MLAATSKRAQREQMSNSLQQAAMDGFVARENIKRYRQLAGETTDSTERLKIMKLLNDEEAKFTLEISRQGDAPEGRPVGRDGARPRSGS
jgi:hypothetical protein